MSLDAIFFDLDDTLFSTSKFELRARRASCEAMVKAGLRFEVDALKADLMEVVAEFSSNSGDHFDQLLRRVPKRFYKGVNPAILVAAGVKAYHDTKVTHLRPFPDAVSLLRDLAQLELVRGIITSGLTVKQAEKIIRLGIYTYLTPTAIYISSQIGINKPNQKLYQRVCNNLNLKPARCLYVGDRATRDIDPANAVGMNTVLIERGGKYQGEQGESAPDHVITHFDALRLILSKDYGLQLPPPQDPAPPAPTCADTP